MKKKFIEEEIVFPIYNILIIINKPKQNNQKTLLVFKGKTLFKWIMIEFWQERLMIYNKIDDQTLSLWIFCFRVYFSIII
jgi:hypothetical protein